MPAAPCAPRPERRAGRRRLSTLPALLVLLLCCMAVRAQQPVHDPRPLRFTDAGEEARFHALAGQLRCVQCQNQSLADSNAQIAQDLRRQVLELIQQGHDDAWIRRFLVQRYGDFVLYQPPLQPATWLLWGGPPLFLLGGGLLLWRVVRRRSRAVPLDDRSGDGW